MKIKHLVILLSFSCFFIACNEDKNIYFLNEPFNKSIKGSQKRISENFTQKEIEFSPYIGYLCKIDNSFEEVIIIPIEMQTDIKNLNHRIDYLLMKNSKVIFNLCPSNDNQTPADHNISEIMKKFNSNEKTIKTLNICKNQTNTIIIESTNHSNIQSFAYILRDEITENFIFQVLNQLNQ